MSGHTYTHTHTHIHTYTHDNYYNPRCAHAHRWLIIDYIITDAQLLEVLGNVHVDGTDIGSSGNFLVWMELG